MQIQETECAGKGVYKITALSDGVSNIFYLRSDYLHYVKEEELCASACFIEERSDDILNAALCFAAEKKAVSYLERSEQCRAGLEKKLFQKNFSKEHTAAALDYLESRKFLSDGRFARAWLNSHKISKPQGRTRLMAELAARGIGRADCENALKEFFSENDEYELCLAALKKRLREKKSGDKLIAALQRDGFSYRMIQKATAGTDKQDI